MRPNEQETTAHRSGQGAAHYPSKRSQLIGSPSITSIGTWSPKSWSGSLLTRPRTMPDSANRNPKPSTR